MRDKALSNQAKYEPLVSIVIPTYNEEEDIEKCLSAVLAQRYSKNEIIVVDSASTDNTPKILEKYAKGGLIKLIFESERRGVASARNKGIKAAKGEIVILLNADVILDEGFINKILKHYKKGADFVVCWSQVANQTHPIPAYLQAINTLAYWGRDDLVWSEGFSCKRKALLNIGGFKLFPKGSAGEDAALGFDLEKKGHKRVLDKSIIVPHIVSTKLKEFMKRRYERGKGSAFFEKYYLRKSTKKTLFILMGVSSVIIASLLLLPINIFFILLLSLFSLSVVLTLRSYKLSKLNTKYREYLFSFFILSVIDFICVKVGYFKDLLRLHKGD